MMWNPKFEEKIGNLMPSLRITSNELQINNSNEELKTRFPTAIATLPSHNVVFIGFDNGDIQTYVTENLASNSGRVSWEAGSAFRPGNNQSVILLEAFEGWNPFPDEPMGNSYNKSSVVYGGVSNSDCLFLYWVLDSQVALTWIKYQLPENGIYHLTDACLCPGMQKVVAGTDRGRLMLFDAQRKGQVVNSALPVNEVVETKMIVKVAHEGGVTCVTSNKSGFLILSGGKDGKICIWQWAEDHFPHQVGYMYMTNLPVQSIISVKHDNANLDPNEIYLLIGNYVINLRVWTRTSRLYMLEQQPSKNIKLMENFGKLHCPNSMSMLPDCSSLLTLSNALGIVTSGQTKDSIIPAQQSIGASDKVLCFSHQHQSVELQSASPTLTAVAVLRDNINPTVEFWWKEQK